MIDFRLQVANPGDPAVVTVYFSDRAPKEAKWFKYDPIEGVWVDYSAYSELGANKKSITLWLQDGGMGDGDGIANGIIVDPSGLSADADQSGSSDTQDVVGNLGCFISTAAQGSSVHPAPEFLRQRPGMALGIMLLLLIVLAGNRLVSSRLPSR